MKHFHKWRDELHMIDTPRNHKKTLKRVLKNYLTSTAADDTLHREDVIFLFRHIKKILK